MPCVRVVFADLHVVFFIRPPPPPLPFVSNGIYMTS